MGQEAAETLLQSCDGFVKQKADKYKRKVDFEDGCQLGMMGLLRAIRDFDLNQDVKFLTYGGWKARATIQSAYRQRCKRGYVQYDFANVAAPEEPEQEAQGIDLSRIESRRRYIVEQYYLHDRSMADIAQELGIHKERVRQLRDEAVEKLREITRRPE